MRRCPRRRNRSCYRQVGLWRLKALKVWDGTINAIRLGVLLHVRRLRGRLATLPRRVLSSWCRFGSVERARGAGCSKAFGNRKSVSRAEVGKAYCDVHQYSAASLGNHRLTSSWLEARELLVCKHRLLELEQYVIG